MLFGCSPQEGAGGLLLHDPDIPHTTLEDFMDHPRTPERGGEESVGADCSPSEGAGRRLLDSPDALGSPLSGLVSNSKTPERSISPLGFFPSSSEGSLLSPGEGRHGFSGIAHSCPFYRFCPFLWALIPSLCSSFSRSFNQYQPIVRWIHRSVWGGEEVSISPQSRLWPSGFFSYFL